MRSEPPQTCLPLPFVSVCARGRSHELESGSPSSKLRVHRGASQNGSARMRRPYTGNKSIEQTFDAFVTVGARGEGKRVEGGIKNPTAGRLAAAPSSFCVLWGAFFVERRDLVPLKRMAAPLFPTREATPLLLGVLVTPSDRSENPSAAAARDE